MTYRVALLISTSMGTSQFRDEAGWPWVYRVVLDRRSPMQRLLSMLREMA